MQRVLIGGGTGLIGKRLSVILKAKGYEVRHLSRRANPSAEFPAFKWDPNAGTMDEAALENVDYVINLAGAGIADKAWTKKRKQVIIDSRVKSNALLFKKIKASGRKVKTFLAASAIGYYGDRGNEELTESSSAGTSGFLAESCVAWESAFSLISSISERHVIVRIGIVLSTKGGALEKMLIPFNFGMGNYFGDGQMYTSWIHIDDVCRIFIAGIQNENMSGIYNGTAPEPVTGKALIYAIKEAKGSSALVMPAPIFALKIGLGERVEMLTGSARVIPKRTLESGFKFEYENLVGALKDVIENGK